MTAVDLQADILEAEEALRQALLNGSETRGLHEKLAALRTAQARAATEMAQAKAQADADAVATHRARITEIAERHAADAAARISGRMATFATPPLSAERNLCV